MTQTDNPPTHDHALSPLARLAWLFLIVATLYVCYFHNLGAIGLVGPDEPRYAWIARAMAETGDWVTPRLYGSPWFEKPVLYYWGAALSFKLFGVSDVTARLPSAICALLATLAMAWLAWRLNGAETARWLLLLLPSTVGMIGFSHAAATDMPFAAMLTIAMICAAAVVGLARDASKPILPLRPWLALLLLGFFLGLAVLAKGPAAIILAGGSVLLWAIVTKRWRDAFRCLHPIAIASFCLTALPWYVLCARRNPDFFRVFIIEHNFKRYLTPEFQHIQPFWFYVPILLVGIFPWTVLLVPYAKRVLEARKGTGGQFPQAVFFLSWPVFTFMFFTASKSKLPGYMLPAIPPLMFPAVGCLVSSLETKKLGRWLIFALGASLLAAGIAFVFAAHKVPADTDIRPAPVATQIAFLAILAGIVISVLAFLGRCRLAVFAMMISVLALILNTDRLLSEMDCVVSARVSLAEAARTWPGFNLDNAATWQLRRSLFYQLNFYAHKELPEWQAGQPKPQWLLIEPQFTRQARGMGFVCRDYLVYPAVASCQNPDLRGGFAGLGALGGDDDLGDGADRQAR